MHISQPIIDELLEKVNIVDVVGERIALQKRGANHTGCCPFHNEKTPSFSVNEVKQYFYCFGCSASGNSIKFIMNYEHKTFVEAVVFLANQYGVHLPQESSEQQKNTKEKYKKLQKLYQLLEVTVAFYEQNLLRARPDSEIIKYLNKREIHRPVQQQYRLGYSPDVNDWQLLVKYLKRRFTENEILEAGLATKGKNGKIYDRFRARLIFPICNSKGKFIGLGGRILRNKSSKEAKYLNSPETPLFKKKEELYGLYQVHNMSRAPQYIIIVEGYLDVIALTQAGFQCGVASLGTAIHEQQLRLLFRYTKTVICCFDSDAAGKKAALKTLELFLPIWKDDLQLKFLNLPEGEDPDSFIRKNGNKAFEKRISVSISCSEFLFTALKEKYDYRSLEGKAAFIRSSVDWIKKIKDSLLQRMFYERLASESQIPLDTLLTGNYIGKSIEASSNAASSSVGRFEQPIQKKNIESKQGQAGDNGREALFPIEETMEPFFDQMYDDYDQLPKGSTSYLPLDQEPGTYNLPIDSQRERGDGLSSNYAEGTGSKTQYTYNKKQKKPFSEKREAAGKSDKIKAKSNKLYRHGIAILLHYPKFALDVEPLNESMLSLERGEGSELEVRVGEEIPLLWQLVEDIQACPKINPPMLLSYYSGDVCYDLLVQLSKSTFLLEEEGLRGEFLDVYKSSFALVKRHMESLEFEKVRVEDSEEALVTYLANIEEKPQ